MQCTYLVSASNPPRQRPVSLCPISRSRSIWLLADQFSNGKKFAKWYEKARQALLGEEQIEAEANEARWAGIRAAVEDRLAEHLKPIEEHEGDFPAFINVCFQIAHSV